MLEFSSFSSGAIDTPRAVEECLSGSLGARSADCVLLIFYTSMGHDFGAIYSVAHRLCPAARVVGTTASGVIGREGANESLRALGVMAVFGPREEVAVAGDPSIIGADPFAVSARIARELKAQSQRTSIVLYHPSADIHPALEAIRGIESQIAGVGVCGSVSLDNGKLVTCYQFINDRLFERGAVAVGFADPSLELVAQANHGFRVVDGPFVVTRSTGNRILELDGLPAWERVTVRLGLPVDTDQMEVIGFAVLAEEIPERLQAEYGSPYIARGGAVKVNDASILLSANCPEGTRLWILRRDEEGIFAGMDELMKLLVVRTGGRKPVAVFHADCAARGRFLFNRVLKEEIVRMMQYPLGIDEGLPWLGMYGAGELTQLDGRNEIHMYTTSLNLFLRRPNG